MHPIWLVPAKVFTHFVFKRVHADIDVVYVKESDTHDRRLKRKYESRQEITGFMLYANNKDT